MGYNTVAFVLNDLMHELQRSPKTVAHALSCPPHSAADVPRWKDMVRGFADDFNEPRLHPQALEVLPTFHADWMQFIVAGGNCIETLEVLRYGKAKDGAPTVTLKLPNWWRR